MRTTPENPSSKVTVEKLLRLKRAERPEAAFWDGFDRELRRRQLATVVNSRPWYARFARGTWVALRRGLPVGALGAAALAAFVIWQQDQARVAATAATSTAAIDPDALPVTLPEMRITSTPALPPAAQEGSRAPAAVSKTPERYVVQEFASAVEPQRRFATMASPYTLSASEADVGGYMINTLTTGPAHRSTVPAASGSF
jgi:hypothetical protein